MVISVHSYPTIPKYVAVVRPRLADVPFSGTFIGFKIDAAIEFDEEVDVCSWRSLEICVSWEQKNKSVPFWAKILIYKKIVLYKNNSVWARICT